MFIELFGRAVKSTRFKLWCLISRVWVCDACVLEQDTLTISFSPPRGKWVPVRAEMVLVIDLDEQCICCTGCILPTRELRWFKHGLRNDLRPSDQGVINVKPFETPFEREKQYLKTNYYYYHY